MYQDEVWFIVCLGLLAGCLYTNVSMTVGCLALAAFLIALFPPPPPRASSTVASARVASTEKEEAPKEDAPKEEADSPPLRQSSKPSHNASRASRERMLRALNQELHERLMS